MPKKKIKPETIEKSSMPTKKISKKLLLLSLILVVLLAVLSFELVFFDKFYPGLFVGGINITRLNNYEANQKITKSLVDRANTTLEFTYQQEKYPLTINSNDLVINPSNALIQAMQYGRTKPYFTPQFLEADIQFNNSLNQKLDQIAEKIDQPALNSEIKYQNVEINVTPSQNGVILDQQNFKKALALYINTGVKPTSTLPTTVSYPKLSYQQAIELKKNLDEIKLHPIVLKFEDTTWEIDLQKALELIDLSSSKPTLISTNAFNQQFNISSAKIGDKEYSDSKLTFDSQKLNDYLNSLSKDINRPVVEPLFNFDGKKVTQFQPPIEGKKLQTTEAISLINNSLVAQNSKIVELPVETIKPKNQLTNDLGIKELIGQGASNFSGSIPNRIYNIGLAASKINGVLIAPGETFSFDNTVGDISAAQGYKQAYVIKSGRTVLDDGGGVCQVSTTLFRAVLNSGLPVLTRTAHAYRVGYYEQGYPPGLDATIFYPSVDFKFKNDTTHHILIQASAEGTSLYVNFYGTSDGRISQVSTPIITNSTPAPPELRQDDPTLPKGTVKQVDFAAAGATVVFKRTVTRNGETLINESFRSNYRPWQAVFLVGTKEG